MEKHILNMTEKELFDHIVKEFRDGKAITTENVSLFIGYAEMLETELEILRGKVDYVFQTVSETFEGEEWKILKYVTKVNE